MTTIEDGSNCEVAVADDDIYYTERQGPTLPPYEDGTEPIEERAGCCNGDKPYEDDAIDIDDDDERSRPRARKRYMKRPMVDPEELLKVRKRLFYEGHEQRLSEDVFYIEGERIDMSDRKKCELQYALFARIFNSMMNFSKTQFEDRNVILQQNMRWEAKFTANRLSKLQNSKYKNYHIHVTSAVSYILRALEDIKHIRREEMIYQLVPMTCVIDDVVKKRLQVNSLELRQINNNRSLSVNLNVDVKFLYVGMVRVKTTPDQGEKYFVAPTRCMGAYIHDAVSDLYDLVYDRTKAYISGFFERYPQDPPVGPSVTTAFEETDAFNGPTSTAKEQNDRVVLKYLLRAVGRGINLRKLDLDRIEVFVLTSAAKTKPKYLNARNASGCRIDNQPVVDTEGVFLSSFTRARIMEDGSLHFQIYSRASMYLSDDQEFPDWPA